MKFHNSKFILVVSLILVLKVNSAVPFSEFKEHPGSFSNIKETPKSQKLRSFQNLIESDFKEYEAKMTASNSFEDPIEIPKETNNFSSDKSSSLKRHKRFEVMPQKWSSPKLTYRFDHKNKEQFVQEEENIRRILREAFDVWQKDTILHFTEITEGIADIMITLEQPNHTEIDQFIFGSETMGHAFPPGLATLNGDIHLNEMINWDFNVGSNRNAEEGKISLFTVILHFIGQSLGLKSNNNRGSPLCRYYYEDRISSLAEDDIRGIEKLYGKKDEVLDVDEYSIIPDKCNTSYDAVAMIDDELIAFKGKYMFGPNMDVIEIRSRWSQLPFQLNHVDAVYQTSDKKVLIFINQNVYIFDGNRLEISYNLKDFGLGSMTRKVDAIFKMSNNNQIYIFVGKYYYKFDERIMTVIRTNNRITKAFKGVFDFDTAFTYKDGKTYFIKNENFYEFVNENWTLLRTEPKLSANYFMYCSLENFE